MVKELILATILNWNIIIIYLILFFVASLISFAISRSLFKDVVTAFIIIYCGYNVGSLALIVPSFVVGLFAENINLL